MPPLDPISVETQNEEDARHLWAGMAAGLIGSVIMLLVLTLNTALDGVGFWLPVRVSAALFMGVRAIVGGPGSLLLGVVIHLLVGGVLGGIFAVLLGDRRPGALVILLGIAYSLAILLAMTFIVLPAVNPVMAARVRVIPWTWLLAHVVYGVCLALTPLLVTHAPERKLI